MPIVRSTFVVPDRTALIHARTRLALEGTQGTQVMTLQHLLARLAGGFLRAATPRDVEPLLSTDVPRDGLPSLTTIADLPGFGRAVARTLDLAWRAGFDLEALRDATPQQPRWSELAILERYVSERLPSEALPARRLARRALEGVRHAPETLGDVHLHGLDDVPRVYRPVLDALAEHVTVEWTCPIPEPTWKPSRITLHTPSDSTHPGASQVESHATPHQEVRNALRWLRGMLEAGTSPADLAIVAPNPGPYEPSLFALLETSDLPVHAVQGIPTVRQPMGQLFAALADAVTHEPSRARIERLIHAGHAAEQTALMRIPPSWSRGIDPARTFPTNEAWPAHAPSDLPDDTWDLLRNLRDDLITAREDATHLAHTWLEGETATTWRDLAERGPLETLPARVARHRLNDETDPTTSTLWGPVDVLLGTPRKHVRMLGMTSGAWPRANHEDPLLPTRILAGHTLEERTQAQIDRTTFHAIARTATASLTLTFPRMGSDGKAQRRSPLLAPFGDVHVVTSTTVSDTPIDERDRRRQRPHERHADPLVQRAVRAFEHRHADALTPYDGMLDLTDEVSTALQRVLDAPLSATTVVPLINDPFQFLAEHVLRWSEPPLDEQPLQLDPLSFGALCHDAIERTQRRHGLDPNPDAVHAVVREVCDAWASDHPVPPAALWLGYQERITRFVLRALKTTHDFPTDHSYPEVQFGDARFGNPNDLEGAWDGTATVRLGASTLRGKIDRLDLSDDGLRVRVIDYKTGRSKTDNALEAEREVQRTVYAVAVKRQLGKATEVDAVLHYLADDRMAILPAYDVDASIARLKRTLDAARARLAEGHAVPAASVPRYGHAFTLALPAHLGPYLERKRAALEAMHAPVDTAWKGEDA